MAQFNADGDFEKLEKAMWFGRRRRVEKPEPNSCARRAAMRSALSGHSPQDHDQWVPDEIDPVPRSNGDEQGSASELRKVTVPLDQPVESKRRKVISSRSQHLEH